MRRRATWQVVRLHHDQTVEQLWGKLLPRYVRTQLLPREMLESPRGSTPREMTAMESADEEDGENSVIDALTCT